MGIWTATLNVVDMKSRFTTPERASRMSLMKTPPLEMFPAR